MRGGERFVDSMFIDQLRRAYLAPLENPTRRQLAEELFLITSLSILIDLIAQGWKIKETTPNVLLEFECEGSLEAEKQRIRRAHLIERDSQVREPSVTAFIRSMEKRRLTPTGWHSIFSVMRDGCELAEALKRVEELESEDEQLAALRSVIKPYLQFVDAEAVCEQTGLRLNDIWRYFRHTWVNSYKSVPGLFDHDSRPRWSGSASSSHRNRHRSHRQSWLLRCAAGRLDESWPVQCLPRSPPDSRSWTVCAGVRLRGTGAERTGLG